MRTRHLFLAVALALSPAVVTSQPEPPIDFERARELIRKERQGVGLTPEERAYLERARAARRAAPGPVAPRGEPSIGLKPLTDMTATDTYKGEDGGLYGGGSNRPPEAHLELALRAAEQVRPRDERGNPADDGKVVMVSVGMSNTTQEFSEFVRLYASQRPAGSALTVVDGAQGGMEAADWATPDDRFRKDRPAPWEVLRERLRRAGVTPEQVQVAWVKQARRNPAALGEFPKHAEEFNGHMVRVLNRLKVEFPNLRIAYLSSRIYAGYAATPLNPEPYAYESGFAVRRLIRRQIDGDAALNPDPTRGDVKAPVLLWGPYLWADGEKGRSADELVWTREDFAPDGTHPGATGRAKVAEQLLKFFRTDPTAKPWFAGQLR